APTLRRRDQIRRAQLVVLAPAAPVRVMRLPTLELRRGHQRDVGPSTRSARRALRPRVSDRHDTPEDDERRGCSHDRTTHRDLRYLTGEKSVGLRNTESTLTTDGPSLLVASRIGMSTGSARNASQAFLAASRLSWATM